jgi:hypothetical protein
MKLSLECNQSEILVNKRYILVVDFYECDLDFLSNYIFEMIYTQVLRLNVWQVNSLIKPLQRAFN